MRRVDADNGGAVPDRAAVDALVRAFRSVSRPPSPCEGFEATGNRQPMPPPPLELAAAGGWFGCSAGS